MRVAVLHYYLNQYGGAERVLQAILEFFPNADLYTLLYDKERTHHRFEKYQIVTSMLDLPLVRRLHRAFIPLMPFATTLLRSAQKYDLVVSSSAGYGKGIRVDGIYHVCYCHSPLRYAWDIEYIKDLPLTPWPLKETVVRPIARWLRAWDVRAAQRVNLFLANSEYIAQKIKAYYKRESLVVYPPVDREMFYPEKKNEYEEYYCMVGRMLYYKMFHVGIEAFEKLRKPLLLVGAGPEAKKLAARARSRYITFLPHVSDAHLRVIYSNARAVIFPQTEDFGLVAAEAQSCGTPVITYARGGGAEIVINRKTGLHMQAQTSEAIVRAVQEREKMKFDPKVITRAAERFSKELFSKNFMDALRAGGVSVPSRV